MTVDEDPELLLVRRARLEEVAELARDCHAEQLAAYGREAEPALPSGAVVWIALEGRQPVGYAVARLRPDGATVGPVYTVPAARRRGVGVRLLDSIQAWAAETAVPIVEVSVDVDNEAGLAFLRALGYRPRRLLLSLRPDGDPA